MSTATSKEEVGASATAATDAVEIELAEQPGQQPVDGTRRNGAVHIHIEAEANGNGHTSANGATNGNGHAHPAHPHHHQDTSNADIRKNSDALEPPTKERKLASSGSSAASAGGDTAQAPAWKPQISPEVNANWLSVISFWWLNGIMHKGTKTALMDEDMYEVTDTVEAKYLSDRFDVEWKIELEKQAASKKGGPGVKPYEPSIKWACYRIFKWQFWAGGCCKAVIDGLQFLQPILLEWLLTFIAETQYPVIYADGTTNTPPVWHGYVLAVAMGLNPFITTVLSNIYFRLMMTIGLRARTILTTQLYKKSLRLSPAAKQTMSVGQIVNMMSTDAAKVDLFMGYIHFLWSALEQVIIAIALLVRAIGPPAFAGVAVIFVMIPLQGFVMQHLAALRRATVKYTDARVKLMNEILQGIRVIKVYAWESSFLQKLINLRNEEMRFVKKSAFTRAWNSTIMQTGPILMSLLAFITVGLTRDSFAAQDIFSSLVLFNLLRMPLLLFPMTLSFWSDARIGCQRICAFLLAEELHSEPEYVETTEFAVNVDHADFTWERVEAEVSAKGESVAKAGAAPVTKPAAALDAPAGKDAASSTKGELSLTIEKSLISREGAEGKVAEVVPFHLDDVTFTIPKGSLTVIVGAVGSGKSSLLAGILGEMKRVAGNVQISGRVGYCPQQAWIQNATLKDNILFGKPFDQKKYDDAIKYCALASDIEVLPAKDATEIGEKGINLSGGQKQRVNLARAVYFDADIIMLDDPLSAVDAHVSKFLFNSCICDKLKDKTRILVTHQLQYVSSCDYVLYLESGKITESGTFSELMAAKKNFAKLISTYVGEEDEDNSSDSEGAEGAVAADEEKSPDNTTGLVRRKKAPKKKESMKHEKEKGLKTAKSSAKFKTLTKEEKAKKEEERLKAVNLMSTEERTKGGVPLAVYLYYVKHCGGWFLISIALGLMCLQTAASSWTTWWLGLWTSDHYNHGSNWYLGIYAGLGLSQCFFALIGSMFSAYMGIIAALELHNNSFESVLRAPMSFFDTTPIGRIINRFSRDQDVIDSLLMDTLRMIIFMVLIVMATFVMICYVTPWFLVPLAPVMVVYWFVQKQYRESSRELKRLESISRSPLFAHFSETLTGLATIRAYRCQQTFSNGNEARMNANNRSYYLLVLTQRWLSIRVETIGSIISFFAALIIVIQRNTLSAGQAGVSLTYAVSVTALLNWVVRQTVEAENCMNSVERSKYYSDKISQEAPAKIPEIDEPLKKTWPTKGAIEFQNLEIRYREGLPLVLHGISLDIKGGERIGIVGRTGAGKSSLMVALFRIVEAASGTIKIDGVDISKIGLDALRSKLAIIPQDPVLYSGTVRSNLDPFNEYTDAQLWDVLGKAYLRDTVSALEKKLLDPVSENGENFSVGQRCQICLARAMLRNAKVLIMDEATASVDMETDSFIQNSLRKNFNCTLLTIAHRLNTICDYDRVLVLSFGLVQEFDTPANLLRDPNSAFSSMVNETGEANAALLRTIAFRKERGERVDDMKLLLGAEGDLGELTELGLVSPSQANQPGAAPFTTEPKESSKLVWHKDEEDESD